MAQRVRPLQGAPSGPGTDVPRCPAATIKDCISCACVCVCVCWLQGRHSVSLCPTLARPHLHPLPPWPPRQVILTPGKDCHAAEPGFFRLCFAWMPPKALPEAVRRIKLLMGSGSGSAGASECSVQ